jgi:hypothetical protein
MALTCGLVVFGRRMCALTGSADGSRADVLFCLTSCEAADPVEHPHCVEENTLYAYISAGMHTVAASNRPYAKSLNGYDNSFRSGRNHRSRGATWYRWCVVVHPPDTPG